jgi:hypothetical protein
MECSGAGLLATRLLFHLYDGDSLPEAEARACREYFVESVRSQCLADRSAC